jgi:hypothetical protein
VACQCPLAVCRRSAIKRESNYRELPGIAGYGFFRTALVSR